ncbi:uncharacterized protein LOC110844963 [Folsomia candida]|nr:uncharacterized protein LOC110844963 [Folsomia candida]
MAKFFTFFAIFAFYIFETTIAQSQAYPNYIQQDIKWTRAINAKLCSPNGHHEAIAQQFYACYNEGIVPGANQYTACQNSIYGVQLNNVRNIGVVCAAGNDKLRKYAACIVTRLHTQSIRASDSIHKLNVCQGGVLGVLPPS